MFALALAAAPALPTLPLLNTTSPWEVRTTKVDVTFKDCGGAHAVVTDINPKVLPVDGSSTAINGEGDLDEDISTVGAFEMTMTGVGGVSLLSNCKGDGLKPMACDYGLGPIVLGTLTYGGVQVPTSKGHIKLDAIVTALLHPGVPSFAAATTTRLTVVDGASSPLVCVDIMTKSAD
jgi:hypothetical protein